MWVEGAIENFLPGEQHDQMAALERSCCTNEQGGLEGCGNGHREES